MTPAFQIENVYPERMPEQLALAAYRQALQSQSAASVQSSCHEPAGRVQLPETESAGLSLAGMAQLVDALGKCAGCPLKCSRPADRAICREECLLLSMLSGIQHGDDETAFVSAIGLAGPQGALDVIAAGGTFAIALKQASQILLPVPADRIWKIVNTASHAATRKRELN